MPFKKIAINTRFLIKDKLEGIGWYTYENTKRITQLHPDIEFHFIFDRAYDSSFLFANNIIPHIVHPPARHPFLWYAWFECSLPTLLKKIAPDVFVSPDGMCSLSTNVATHLTIHDISFKHYPQYINRLAAYYYNYYTPKYIKKANRIATVSEFSKQDLITSYNANASHIDVVYNGANTMYTPLKESDVIQIRNTYSAGKPYFLYVGSLHPRKNIGSLFKAYDLFRKQQGVDYRLVIAGRKAWQTDEIERIYQSMEYKNDVIFLGHIQADKLRDIIGAAYTMIYVSCFEGFGIPILEAMHCDIPSIISNTSSMPEVGGNASIQVSPLNIEQITEAMHRITTDMSLYTTLITNSRIQRQQFSWDKTANAYWKSIESCI